MIMVVGLPGAGKTTWSQSTVKQYPIKRYNIIGTDTLIDKMRVMGLPRRNNYHGRWEILIQKATNCLNKLFQIGGFPLKLIYKLIHIYSFNLIDNSLDN